MIEVWNWQLRLTCDWSSVCINNTLILLPRPIIHSIHFNFICFAPNHYIHYLEALYIEGQDLKMITTAQTVAPNVVKNVRRPRLDPLVKVFVQWEKVKEHHPSSVVVHTRSVPILLLPVWNGLVFSRPAVVILQGCFRIILCHQWVLLKQFYNVLSLFIICNSAQYKSYRNKTNYVFLLWRQIDKQEVSLWMLRITPSASVSVTMVA